MKKILTLLTLCFMFIGCRVGNKSETINTSNQNSDLVLIESVRTTYGSGLSEVRTFCDTKEHVRYIAVGRGGITVMIDSVGKPSKCLED